MPIRTSKGDIIWSYLGNILNIGMGILILPSVIKMLSYSELGLWYVFSSISGLVNLVDFGFSPTIMRNITYSWCGAKELKRDGLSENFQDGKPNFKLLKNLVLVSKKIYLILSLFAVILLLVPGTFYIRTILPNQEAKYFVSWFIYAFSIMINLYYSYWSPLLKGIGAIKQANQALVVSRIVYILIAIIGLNLGGGLIALSFAFLMSGLIMRLLSKVIFNKIIGREYHSTIIGNSYMLKDLFMTIWPNSKKIGIVTIGGWLITRSSTLLCSSFLGLEVTAQYGVTLQILTIVGSFSQLLFVSYMPEITATKVDRDLQKNIKLFSRAITLQWFIGIVGILSLIILGPIALKLIDSNSILLPSGITTLLGIVLFLEWNHSTFATLITMSNTVPFVRASIYSGIGIVIISLIMLEFTTLGLLSLIISQGVVQLAYNNWYWPRWVLKENDSSVLKILKSSFEDIKYCFIK